MMQAGSTGGGNKEGGKKSPVKDQRKVSVCDLSSNDFKKTWLTLKELHDKEVHHLQAKLTSMRKERLADGRRNGLIAKIKELTKQQKALNETINNLKEQLRSKTCERCSVNETHWQKLQEEFHDIQQQNLKFISELTAERNKLREENKSLLAKLKSQEKPYCISLTDSDEDVDIIPLSQNVSGFSVREQSQRTQMYIPSDMLTQSYAHLMKPEKIKPKQSSTLLLDEIFEVPESSSEKTDEDNRKSVAGKGNQKSSVSFSLNSTADAEKWFEFHDDLNSPEDKPSQVKRQCQRKASTPKITHKSVSQFDFPWSLSSISSGENLNVQLVSETSEENMPGYKSLLTSSPKMEIPSSNVFPRECTLTREKRSLLGTAHYSTGSGVGGVSPQKPSTEQSALKKNIKEPTGTENTADNPESSVVRSTVKRKVRTTQTQRWMK